MGYITLKTGLQSCINTLVAWDLQSCRVIGSIQLGFPHSFVTGSYLHKFEENDTKLKIAVKSVLILSNLLQYIVIYSVLYYTERELLEQ